MILDDAIFVLFRRVKANVPINRWIEQQKSECFEEAHSEPYCLNPSKSQFLAALQTQYPHYSVDEAEYLYEYIREYDIPSYGGFDDFGVFGLLHKSVENMLVTDSRNECLCLHKEMIPFRNLTSSIGSLVFVASYLAVNDLQRDIQREAFGWSTIVRSNDVRLHHILDHGMAENHFHIGGSSDAFIFSWICLMNHFNASRKNEFKESGMDQNPLDTITIGGIANSDNCYTLTFKAVCLRYFLYKRLRNEWVCSCGSCGDTPATVTNCEDTRKQRDHAWLIRMLTASEDLCDVYGNDIDSMLETERQFCTPVNDFVPDYALRNEPLAPSDDNDLQHRYVMAVRNYERRLYRVIAGEQRFQYDLFQAIIRKDPRITPYLDLAYAYLLIYSQIRGELMQINNRVGFKNFLMYQDRKEIFTDHVKNYQLMRLGIAEQAVLNNPQIVSFEGRLTPCADSEELCKKVSGLLLATKHAPGIQPERAETDISSNNIEVNEKTNPKLSYVIHFPKRSQAISNDEVYEITNSRDAIIRRKTLCQVDAIIQAMRHHPDIMRYVTGIDACSSEIGCRPEVFAVAFRKLRGYRENYQEETKHTPIPVCRFTFHAGEDFLDVADGLRAIDEAIRFLEMRNGDRLGHALALGIDCEQWYAFKSNVVLLRKQDLLDNLVWVYGKMHQYGVYNVQAEDKIIKYFKKLFTEIYTNHLDMRSHFSALYSVDILDYYASLDLRGNDPKLYFDNPDGGRKRQEELRRILLKVKSSNPFKVRTNYAENMDPLSNVLYHYYHYNYEMKKEADVIVKFTVPKAIIRAVCEIQEAMMYDVASKKICIECNPSSNYLIGTFKDYMKHPIFRFFNKRLYSNTDPRYTMKNPLISSSINTDDLGIFDTSLENEYALMACAMELYNEYCPEELIIPDDNIYEWLDRIRNNGCEQSFIRIHNNSTD